MEITVSKVELLRELGFSYRQTESKDGRFIAVAEAQCRYRAPVRYDEEVLVRTELLNVRDSVVVTDLEGIVTYWNEGATRLFGWTAEEMLGRHYAERFPAPIRSRIVEEIRSRSGG